MSKKSSSHKSKSKGSEKNRDDTKMDLESDNEELIDLCDDHDYQVLSAVFETPSGKNIADILSKLQKDVHLIAMSLNQVIQLALAAQTVRDSTKTDDESDGENNSDEEEEENSDNS